MDLFGVVFLQVSFLGNTQIPGADPGAAGSGQQASARAEKCAWHSAVCFGAFNRQGQPGCMQKQKVFQVKPDIRGNAAGLGAECAGFCAQVTVKQIQLFKSCPDKAGRFNQQIQPAPVFFKYVADR